MARAKALTDLLPPSRRRRLGLTRVNRDGPIHELEGLPQASDDEISEIDKADNLSDGIDENGPPQLPAKDAKKRKSDRARNTTDSKDGRSDRVRTGFIIDKSRATTTHVETDNNVDEGDPFSQDLYGSRGKKQRKMYGSQTHQNWDRQRGPTPNIHKALRVKRDSMGSRSPVDRSDTSDGRAKFRPPPKSTLVTPPLLSAKKQPAFKLPPGFKKEIKQDNDVKSEEDDPQSTSTQDRSSSSKPQPKFFRPNKMEVVRSEEGPPDIIKVGQAGLETTYIRDKLSAAAGKLDVDGDATVRTLLCDVKDSSIPLLIEDDALPLSQDIDLPDLPTIISSSATEPTLMSCASSAQVPQSSGLTFEIDLTETGETLCPFCKDAIDNNWMEANAPSGRLSVRQQAELCKAHKIHSAHEEWKKRGYPDIDWSHFDARLNDYHDRIEKLLDDKHTSFYRNVLEDKLRKGNNRTLRQALIQGEGLEGLVPGYYGTKGGKMIVDNIIARFSTKLRRLDRFDKLIQAAGTSGYVQAVLGPEMAVMLVMDDLKMDEEGAREILRDSVDIGNLLNEEEDETLAVDIEH